MPSWIKKITKTFKGSSGKSSKLRPRSATWSVGTESSSSSKGSSNADDDLNVKKKAVAPVPTPNGNGNIRHVNPSKLYHLDETLGGKLKKWEHAVVVVIGASAGIGSSICISLVRHGFTVVGCSKTTELVNAISEECSERGFKGKLYAHKSDLLYESDVKVLFSSVLNKFGRIDILINNPELVNDYAVKRLPTEALRQLLHKRILTLVTATKYAARCMNKQKGGKGHIFNICSTSDLITTEYKKILEMSSPSTKRASKGIKQLASGEATKVQVTTISPGKAEAEFFRRIYGEKYVDENPLFNDSSFSSQEVANALLSVLANS